jgi:hypothetical protein
MLKELGMEFAPSWEDMYTKLSLYKSTHGNIHNVATDGADPILASWMARQNDILFTFYSYALPERGERRCYNTHGNVDQT